MTISTIPGGFHLPGREVQVEAGGLTHWGHGADVRGHGVALGK